VGFSVPVYFLNTRENFGNPKNLIMHGNATPDSHYISKPSVYFRLQVSLSVSRVIEREASNY
jgi:hypothetical protein